MYETFVGLNKRPFAAVPLVEGYFPGTVCEDARQSLVRCIERGEGIGVVVGPVGTGKTLLCMKLAEELKDSFRAVVLSSGRLSTRRSLFQAILYELDQPYRSMDEGELRLALTDYLTLAKDQSRGLALVIDEAHTLPLKLLDEIRMLTDLARGGQALVRVILSGSCALEERLANPKLDSFNSRIATRCYLEAFNRSETTEYVRAKIAMCGGDGEEVFSDDACQSVYQATEGVPRLINQLCDHALLVAFSAGRLRLEASQIEEAWADLQQLPTPWNGDNQGDKPGVIEFGRLDDMPEMEEAESIKMPTPPLKLNTEIDDFDFAVNDRPEPTEQIDSISDLITGAEEAVGEVAAAKPEVELTFEEFDHPFEELFEHEEIVNERYAAPTPAISVLQSVVPVFEFGTLEKSSEEAAQTEASLAAQGITVPIEVHECRLDEPPIAQVRDLSGECEASPAVAEETFDSKKTLVMSRPGRDEKRRSATIPMTSVAKEHPNDEAKPIQAVRPVRRNEYGRLFAKLRHG